MFSKRPKEDNTLCLHLICIITFDMLIVFMILENKNTIKRHVIRDVLVQSLM